MAKLDLGKNKSTIYNPETPGIAYGQDGKLFNNKGDEVDKEGNVMPGPQSIKPAPKGKNAPRSRARKTRSS